MYYKNPEGQYIGGYKILWKLADERGVSASHVKNKGLMLSKDGKVVSFRAGNTSINEEHSKLICKNKEVTKAFLRTAGVSTPLGSVFSTSDAQKAFKFASYIGWPVVVKVIKGARGKGVYPNISSLDELSDVLEELGKGSSSKLFILEEHVSGPEYRFLYLGGKIIAVMERVAANVIGDGSSTVEELINKKNNIRKENRKPSQKEIKIDYSVLNKLKRNGLSLEYKPGKNERVFLRDISNISTGGDGVDRTESISAELKREVEKAAKCIPGLAFAGLDVIVDTDSDTLKYSIIEINTSPWITIHHYPWEGESIDVAKVFMDYAFPNA